MEKLKNDIYNLKDLMIKNIDLIMDRDNKLQGINNLFHFFKFIFE